MTVQEVKAQIVSGNLQPIYFFTGIEIEVRNTFIKQLASHKAYSIIRAESFKEVYNKIKKRGLISQPAVYVITEDAEVLKNEKIQILLKDTKMIGDNILIFTFTSLDKRTKFYKAYKDAICDFEPLDGALLRKYIKKRIKLSDSNCDRLIELCESDYSRILLEIDKIQKYLDGINLDDYDIGFIELLKSGTLYKPPKDAIFDFVDAVMNRQEQRAFQLMQESYDSGEATLVMVTVLYNNIKQTLQVQSCKSKEVSKSTGLTGWQIQCVKKYVNKYSIGELIKMMQLVREMEIGIKTGKIEESIAIPYFLVNVF